MELRQQQEQLEAVTLSPHACRSAQTRGRARPETECGIRTCFQRDTDRIVYSKASSTRPRSFSSHWGTTTAPA